MIPFFNVHLDYVAWGPRRLKKGHSVADVIASENRVRTSAMQRPFAAMRRLRAEGYPIFLTGDFNQPSSLDYTAATAGSRPEIPAPVAWPVSEALFELGFRDSYRETHPDPRKDPGITQESSGERIDYVYAAGPSTTVASKLVGERGGEDVEIVGDAKWTSDHRAVLSTFDVTPMAMPPLVAVSKRLGTVGSRFTVTYNAPGATGGEITVVAHGGDAEPRTTLAAPGARGTARFATKAWKPGRYDVVLSDSAGAEVARVRSCSAARRPACACRPTGGRTPAAVPSGSLAPRARQPVGLARGLQGVRPGPRRGRLPDLAVRRRPFGRHGAAEDPRPRDARRREPGEAVAAPAGRLCRPLPARRPVRLGGQGALPRLASRPSAPRRRHRRANL